MRVSVPSPNRSTVCSNGPSGCERAAVVVDDLAPRDRPDHRRHVAAGRERVAALVPGEPLAPVGDERRAGEALAPGDVVVVQVRHHHGADVGGADAGACEQRVEVVRAMIEEDRAAATHRARHAAGRVARIARVDEYRAPASGARSGRRGPAPRRCRGAGAARASRDGARALRRAGRRSRSPGGSLPTAADAGAWRDRIARGRQEQVGWTDAVTARNVGAQRRNSLGREPEYTAMLVPHGFMYQFARAWPSTP